MKRSTFEMQFKNDIAQIESQIESRVTHEQTREMSQSNSVFADLDAYKEGISDKLQRKDPFHQLDSVYANPKARTLLVLFLQLYDLIQDEKTDKAEKTDKSNSSLNNAINTFYTAVRDREYISLKTYNECVNTPITVRTSEIYGKCPFCNVQFIMRNDYTFCPNCYLESTNLNSIDNSSNGVDKFKTVYLYKRVNHYINKLDKLTACEKTNVPPEVINAVKHEMTIQKRKSKLTIDQIRAYLVKHRYTKYMDNIHQIYKIITGNEYIVIPPMVRSFLIRTFIDVDQALAQLNKEGVTNTRFLNYNYLHYKICEHLGYKNYQNAFMLCKSQDKIISHDLVWQQICKKLGWIFIPTV